MEKTFLPMESISNMWVSPSSMYIAIDMSFGIICGVGLFYLLILFLKKYPVSPPPESKGDIPKQDVQRGQSNTRKETAAVKDYRNSRKDAQDAQNASPPTESPTKNPLLDSTEPPFWNSKKKLDQLPISPMLSYLKVLEELIQKKCSQISSVFPESVVATAWVSRKPPSVKNKTSHFSDSYSPLPAFPLAQGPPHLSQGQPLLPHQLGTPNFLGVTETQLPNRHPCSKPKDTPSSSKSRACGTPYSNPGMKVLTPLPTENQSQQKGLKWEGSKGSNVPKQQEAIRRSTDNLPWGTLLTEAIRSASTLPDHCQMVQDRQKKYRVTEERDHQGPCFQELMNPAGHFPANSPHHSKNGSGPSQTAQPSILDSKPYKSSSMMESDPSRLPLKKRPVYKHDSIKEGRLPCTSRSSTAGKSLEPRKPALRTDQLSYVNTARDLFFLDSKTQMELESNIAQLLLKYRERPDLQAPESRDLIQSGVPASYFPQPVYPLSHPCVSKAEHSCKAAVIPEKLHHQDPGGTKLKIVPATRLRNTLSAHSSSEVKETQRTPSPAASSGHSEADGAVSHRSLNTWVNVYCLLARTQESRTIRGTGRGSLQPRTSSRIAGQVPKKRFDNVASGHPFFGSTAVAPGVRTPPSVSKQTNKIVEIRKETPPPQKETLGPSKIPSGQNITSNLRTFESERANRKLGHFQTCLPHSRGPPLKPQVISDVDFTSDKQPPTSTARLLTDHQHTVHPATVIRPSQQSLPRYKNRYKDPKTSEGLHDVLMRKNHSQETQKLGVPKDKTPRSNHKMFHPNEEKGNVMRSRARSHGEGLGGVQSSQGCRTSTQPKATVIPESLSDVPGNVRSLLTEIKRNLQYLNLDTKYSGQGDSVENESSPPSKLQNQIKGKFKYSMATEAQSLLNVVVHILVDTLGLKIEDPSKIQWCDVEQLLAQLEASSHSSESVYDPKTSQPGRRMSCDHTSPKGHSHPFMYRGTGDRQELSVDALRAHDQHQRTVRRGTGFGQHCTLTEKHQEFRYRENRDKQQPSPAAQRACYPDQDRSKHGKEPCPPRSHEGHKHSFRYRTSGDKEQPGVGHKAFDPHQSAKEGTGFGHLTSPKKNNPAKYRENGAQEQSGTYPQGASDRKTLPK